MADASLFDRMRYTLAQRLRMAWYSGHYMAARRYSGQAPAPQGGAQPSREPVMEALRELLERDWRNIEQGHYRMPSRLFDSPLELARLSFEFLSDLPKTAERRARRGTREVATEERRGRFPSYYLHNFHHQTDGYLSERSARLYDFQVETLFTGTAETMRRQALVPLCERLKGRDQRDMRLLDVACGTGSFLAAVKDNYPRLEVTGLDLSADYLAVARRRLAAWRGAETAEAGAEAMPFASESFDVVTCIYLFHELPARVRRTVAGEMARVLKPGGRLVLVDSLQLGDRTELDALLDAFPSSFHEPYYRSYIREELDELFAGVGLEPRGDTLAFLSKVSVFDKP